MSSTHPYERLVEISCCFIAASGCGLQRQTSLSRTPVWGPVHSDACLHAPAPPPAGCFLCQHVSHVPVREKVPGECAFRDREMSIAALSTPPAKSQTCKLKGKKCARGIFPPHARVVTFSCSLVHRVAPFRKRYRDCADFYQSKTGGASSARLVLHCTHSSTPTQIYPCDDARACVRACVRRAGHSHSASASLSLSLTPKQNSAIPVCAKYDPAPRLSEDSALACLRA
jgi:hypothetical protein